MNMNQLNTAATQERPPGTIYTAGSELSEILSHLDKISCELGHRLNPILRPIILEPAGITTPPGLKSAIVPVAQCSLVQCIEDQQNRARLVRDQLTNILDRIEL